MALSSLVFASCAGSRPPAYSLLSSSSRLQTNPNDKSGKTPYLFSSGPIAGKYSKVVVEPVAIYSGDDQQFDKVSAKQKAVLAQYMKEEFQKELSTRYSLVSRPTSETLRVKVTLTGAKTTPPVVGVFTRFDMAGGPYNVVQSIRGKEGMMTGSVSFAVEVYEGSSDRLLKAYVEKQYPNALNVGANVGALAASKAGIREGAKQLLKNLD